VLTQAPGDFFRSFASNFVIVQTEPDFVEAVQVVILVLDPLLFGSFPPPNGTDRALMPSCE
jgi:hypothetical protein